MNKVLFEYIKRSPTAFHACKSAAKILVGAGYTELYEGAECDAVIINPFLHFSAPRNAISDEPLRRTKYLPSSRISHSAPS